MGNIVSISAASTTTLSLNSTIYYTSVNASGSSTLATFSQDVLDYMTKAEAFPSPASLQISTSLPSKDFRLTSTPSSCTAYCYLDEVGGVLEAQIIRESIESSGLGPQKGAHHAAKIADQLRRGRNLSNIPPPEKGALTGPPESAVIAKKPADEEVDGLTQTKVAFQHVHDAKAISVFSEHPPKGLFLETVDLRVAPSEKVSTGQKRHPIPKIHDSTLVNLQPARPAASLPRSAVMPEKKFWLKEQSLQIHNNLDLEIGASGNPSSQFSFPTPIEESEESGTRQNSVIKPTVVARLGPKTTHNRPVQQPNAAFEARTSPSQISTQLEEETAESTRIPPIRNDTNKMMPGRGKSVAKRPIKVDPIIVYLPKTPIRLFGRPHKHHIRDKVEEKLKAEDGIMGSDRII
jgi:hypothetical protein